MNNSSGKSFGLVLGWGLALLLPTTIFAQDNNCSDVLSYGQTKRDTNSTLTENRQVYDLVCKSTESSSSSSSGGRISGGFKAFSASARKNKSSANEYRDAYCHISKEELFSTSNKEESIRTMSNETLKAFNQCMSTQSGIDFKPVLGPRQLIVSFALSYDRTAAASLKGINSDIFECKTGVRVIDEGGLQEADQRSPTTGGQPIPLTTSSLNINCTRLGTPTTVGNVKGMRYEAGYLGLNLTVSPITLFFDSRLEGAAKEEIVELRELIQSLRTRNKKILKSIEQLQEDLGGKKLEVVYENGFDVTTRRTYQLCMPEGCRGDRTVCSLIGIIGNFGGRGEKARLFRRDVGGRSGEFWHLQTYSQQALYVWVACYGLSQSPELPQVP